MGESTACVNARASLEEIRNLKRDFEVAYDLAVSSAKPDDVKRAQELKQGLETKMKALQKTLAVVEAERLFDLKRQYESQTTLLLKVGLIEMKKETDTSGVEREMMNMKGIDGKEYPVPSYEDVVSRLAERKELLETKADQGFNKLVLVPFGMPIGEMAAKFKQYLLSYKKTHPEFGRTDPSKKDDSDKPTWDPLFVWDEYADEEANGTLVYDPSAFDSTNHGGKTKAEILTKQQADGDTSAGWRVLLLQGGRNGNGLRGIPRNGQAETSGVKVPRQDIEAGKSPREYLADQLGNSVEEDSPYRGESGMCPEEWVAAFLTHLEETGRPMDDYQNNADSIAYLTGTYFTASDFVPFAGWSQDVRQARLRRCGPGNVDEDVGVRSAVRA